MDGAVVGVNGGDCSGLDINACDFNAIKGMGTVFTGSGDVTVDYAGRISDAITTVVAAADDAIKVEEWDTRGNLFDGEEFGLDAVTVLESDVALELLHLGRG